MRKLSGSLGFLLVVLLSGCSAGNVPNIASPSTSGSASVQSARGVVHGGQQPVKSATVKVWEVGSTGYGSAPTPLYSTTTSAVDGTFSFPIAS